MIEQILYMNLDRRPDRKEWFLKEAESAGIPMEIIERVPSKDWKDYIDCEALLEAMQADGFALGVGKSDAKPMLQGTWACSWTYCVCLKKIIASRKKTLLIQDDMIINMSFKDFLKHLECFSSLQDLWAIQLDSVDVPELRPNIGIPYNQDWMYGIRGCSDRAVIYTHWGAMRMLGLIQGCPRHIVPPELALYYHFNNYNTFYPLVTEKFVKHSPHRKPSDVNPTQNSKMIYSSQPKETPEPQGEPMESLSINSDGMLIRWHRPDGVKAFDKEYTRRSFLYSTPVLRQNLSSYLDYPVKKDLGVSLSLSIMPSAPKHYPELLSKQVGWFVKHLCERTDMVEMGVPLRVGITRDMGDICMPYLDACSFPMDRVDWFKNREMVMRRSSKFDAMRYSTFRKVERILHLDMNFLIGSHVSQRPTPAFSRILDLWDDAPTASTGPIVQPRDPYLFTDIRKRLDDMNKMELWEDILKEVASFCGHSESEELDYWDNADPIYQFSTGVFGIKRHLLDNPEFWADLEKLLTLIQSDEVALAIYARAKGWETPKDVDDINSAFNWKTEGLSELFGECDFVPALSENIEDDIWLSQHIQYYPPGMIDTLNLRPEDLI